MAIAIENNAVSKRQQALFERGFKAWCENTSESMRTKLGLEAYDPIPAYELAKKLGVRVWQLEDVNDLPAETLSHLSSHDGDEWSAVTVSHDGVSVIIVNPRHSVGRTSSDLMHELSHIILHHNAGQTFVIGDLMMREYDEKQEAEADWLAGALLLPRRALEYIKYNHISNDDAYDNYRVSSQLYNYRCRMTGVNRQYGR